MLTSVNPELSAAYQQATGKAYADQLREKRDHASLPGKAVIDFFGPQIGGLDDYRMSESGRLALSRLIHEQPGVYLRGALSYMIDSRNRQYYQHELVFPGQNVGEDGEVKLAFNDMPIWLRKGDESVVEVTRGGQRVIHLPEGEGIALRPELDRRVSWAYHGDRITLATWYPDLSEDPQQFSYPQGRIEWVTQASRVS